jgi:hypothetical protein
MICYRNMRISASNAARGKAVGAALGLTPSKYQSGEINKHADFVMASGELSVSARTSTTSRSG